MTKRHQIMFRFLPALLVAIAMYGTTVLATPASAQVPPARALFLDLETVFTQSQVGKNIRAQLEGMLAEIAEREKTSTDNLTAKEQQLLARAREGNSSNLEKDWETLQLEKKGSANLFQIERTAVQAASNNARQQVNSVLNEIMQGILVERGANMVMSVGAVYVGGVDYDITAEVISRLDKGLPTLKVELPR